MLSADAFLLDLKEPPVDREALVVLEAVVPEWRQFGPGVLGEGVGHGYRMLAEAGIVPETGSIMVPPVEN
jgi:hypothetical protein